MAKSTKSAGSKRKAAEDFFIENYEVTQAQVAELFGVTPKTISSWARQDGWVEKRDQYHSSPVKIRQLLQKELLNVAQGETPKLNADSIRKLQITMAEIQKAASPIVVHQILKELDNHISETDPELAMKCLAFHKSFLQRKIEQEG